jgi:hypothetical protein
MSKHYLRPTDINSRQIQNPNFQQNANFQQYPNVQQNPNFQQGPSSQQIPSQQISPISMQKPHSQLMGPPRQRSPWQRFVVPSNSDSISSSFPFHPQLYNLQVTHDEWHQFTSEIVHAAKLSASEDAAAWAAGVTTGAASSAFLLIFGPAVGYYTGKAIHKRTVAKKVKERLLEDGDIRAVLNKWNQGTFKWRGFRVWLEWPTDFMGVIPKDFKQIIPGALKSKPSEEKKQEQKFKLMVFPTSENEAPFSDALCSQEQPGLVEAPSEAPQRPVELENSPAQNVPLQNEAWKGNYPSSVAQVPATAELDTQPNLQGSRPMPAEI